MPPAAPYTSVYPESTDPGPLLHHTFTPDLGHVVQQIPGPPTTAAPPIPAPQPPAAAESASWAPIDVPIAASQRPACMDCSSHRLLQLDQLRRLRAWPTTVRASGCTAHASGHVSGHVSRHSSITSELCTALGQLSSGSATLDLQGSVLGGPLPQPDLSLQVPGLTIQDASLQLPLGAKMAVLQPKPPSGV